MTDLDTVNNNVTVVRGQRGTTAVEHANGSLVKIAPVFIRKAVFDSKKIQGNPSSPKESPKEE